MRSAARRNEVANYRVEMIVDGAAAGSSGHGTAGGTVHITRPDGGRRVIAFRDGKVVSIDAEGSFRVERRDDRTVVRIGRVEVYEIPDAFVFGG